MNKKKLLQDLENLVEIVGRTEAIPQDWSLGADDDCCGAKTTMCVRRDPCIDKTAVSKRSFFLPWRWHLMQTPTTSHNPMMRASMKMAPRQIGNNILQHKKRAQWKMSFKYICKMTFFLDKRISTFYNGGGCTLLNTLCFRVWQGIYLQHLHQP